MGFLEYSEDCGGVDRDRCDGCRWFEDAVVREELHFLQTGSSGGGGGTGAGIECVRLRAVCQSILLQLQVTSQGVNIMDNLVRRRERYQRSGMIINEEIDLSLITTQIIRKRKKKMILIEVLISSSS